MVLIDREIKKKVNKDGLIDSFDQSCLTNIGYDLRAKYFVVSNEKKESVTLQPNESAFVASVEDITMSKDLMGMLTLKNSRIRQGLSLDSPVYQPGHHTKVFFRLTNVSADNIRLDVGEKYATILFEKLSGVPDHPYEGAFSEEFDFKGLGEYRKMYSKQIQEIEKKTEDIKSMEQSIYSNVLVILTVFVALFSFLTANVSLSIGSATVEDYFTCNLLLLGCVSFLVALMKTFVLPGRKYFRYWLPAIVAFAAAFILFCF